MGLKGRVLSLSFSFLCGGCEKSGKTDKIAIFVCVYMFLGVYVGVNEW